MSHLPDMVLIDPSLSEECKEYLKSLSEKELKGYHIALSHLGSSFSLVKSNGFLEWKSKRVK
jgi:hypothetical protein